MARGEGARQSARSENASAVLHRAMASQSADPAGPGGKYEQLWRTMSRDRLTMPPHSLRASSYLL